MVPPNPTNQNKGSQPKQPAAKPLTPPTAPVRKKPNTLIPILIGVGLLLLGSIAWLTYESMSTTRELEQKVAQYEEAEKLRAELENQYNDAIAELEKLKGENEDINRLIDEQKAELDAQRSRISGLIRTQRRLDAARAELRDLKVTVEGYVAEIEQLQEEAEQLALANAMLLGERDSLNLTLDAKNMENTELMAVQAKLVSEKEDLTKSVQIGSVVQVKDVEVTGLRTRKSGKTKSKGSAKRIDQLKVCFTTIVNDVVQPGTEEFFIRIVNPKGETLAIDDLGSGTTTDSRTGEEVRYTQVKEYDYANDETQLCFLWKPNMPFQSGKYDVEIYNKGYLAGKGQFELK